MFCFIILFNKFNPFELKKVTKGISQTQIMFMGKFIHTRYRKTYFSFLLTHSVPSFP